MYLHDTHFYSIRAPLTGTDLDRWDVISYNFGMWNIGKFPHSFLHYTIDFIKLTNRPTWPTHLHSTG